MNTHRKFSRNAASSRAIPVWKLIQAVRDDPFIPIDWGKNKPGMQAGEQLESRQQQAAKAVWLEAIDNAIATAIELNSLELHKEKANRVLEPYSYTTQIISSTSWGNFFYQRISCHAQPEMRHIAELMKAARDASTPTKLSLGGVHLPYITADDSSLYDDLDLVKLSVARCARVSYLTHDGVRDVKKDIELHDRLIEDKHWSPFEHVATATPFPGYGGNFGDGWFQYRKTFEEEYIKDTETQGAY